MISLNCYRDWERNSAIKCTFWSMKKYGDSTWKFWKFIIFHVRILDLNLMFSVTPLMKSLQIVTNMQLTEQVSNPCHLAPPKCRGEIDYLHICGLDWGPEVIHLGMIYVEVVKGGIVLLEKYQVASCILKGGSFIQRSSKNMIHTIDWYNVCAADVKRISHKIHSSGSIKCPLT